MYRVFSFYRVVYWLPFFITLKPVTMNKDVLIFKGKPVTISVKKNIACSSIHLLEADTGFPYMTATKVIPELYSMPHYVAIKNYSENEGVLKFLIENGIIEKPSTFVESGFVKFPICKLKI